jgi:hypothetical protein
MISMGALSSTKSNNLVKTSSSKTTKTTASGWGSIATPITESPTINVYGSGSTSATTAPSLSGDGGSVSSQGAQPLGAYAHTSYPSTAPEMHQGDAEPTSTTSYLKYAAIAGGILLIWWLL